MYLNISPDQLTLHGLYFPEYNDRFIQTFENRKPIDFCELFIRKRVIIKEIFKRIMYGFVI